MPHLVCPRCELELRPPTLLYAPHYCPRCLAEERSIVALDRLPERAPAAVGAPGAPDEARGAPATHS